MSASIDTAARGLEAAVNTCLNAGITPDEAVTLLALQAARLRIDYGAVETRAPRFRYAGEVFGRALFESVDAAPAASPRDGGPAAGGA